MKNWLPGNAMVTYSPSFSSRCGAAVHSGPTPRRMASRNLIFLNFAPSFLHARRWRARACPGAGAPARPAFPCPRVT